MGCVNVWIAPWFLDSKYSKLRNAIISEERGRDFAFSSVDIILKDFHV